MQLNEFIECAGLKGGGAGQEVIDHRAQRIHIGSGTGRLAEQLLWDISLAPFQELIPGQVLSGQFEETAHANIRYGHLAVEADESTVNRKAAVDDRMLMGIFQSGGNLIQVAANREGIQRPIFGDAGMQ